MKNSIIMWILVFVLALLTLAVIFSPLLSESHTFVNNIQAHEPTPKELVAFYANKYGVSLKVIDNVIKGESGYRCNVYGDGGDAFGIAQFHRPTFDRFSKDFGENLDYYSYHDQIKLMAWAISEGYGNHWTVYTRLKKSGII